MTELRRAQLTTLSCNVPFSTVLDKSTLPTSSTPCTSAGSFERNGGNLQQPIKIEPSVRCVVTLFEPGDRTFPEFSYTELVERKKGHITLNDGLEEQENTGDKDEVAAIARLLEEKYSGKNTKKKDRVQDLVDIGYGYDEEDSFIDNSEAYDEFVPAALTTKYGGFYVNSGPLQFRQASDAETDEFASGKDTLKPPTKRKLNEGELEKPKKKRYKEPENFKTTINSKTGAVLELGIAEPARRKKKPTGPLSVTNMLKKFQREKEKERQRLARDSSISGVPPVAQCPADAAGGCSGLADPLLSLIGSTDDHALIQAASTVDFVVDLDSLLDAAVENSPKHQNQLSLETEVVLASRPEAGSHARPASDKDEPLLEVPRTTKPLPDLNQHQLPYRTKTTTAPLLPEGLPPTLERSIEELTAAARSAMVESKLKFFTPEINSMLLNVAVQCEDIGVQVRSRVYKYLAWFLPCSRDTLLKRVKKLLQRQMDPMQKLKDAIGRAMPEQVDRFNYNCQTHAKVKSTKITDGKEREQKGNVISEDEGLERSGKRGPQKKFKWSEEIRNSLYHVVKAKMDRCDIQWTNGQQMEDYLKSFLDQEIKPLWPKGWMQPRILLKESRKMLSQPPLLLAKKTKPEKQHSVCVDPPRPLGGPMEPTGPCAPPTSVPPSQGPLPDTGSPLGEIYGAHVERASLKSLGYSAPCGAEANNNNKPQPGRALAPLSAGEHRSRESPVSQELLAAAMATVVAGGSRGGKPRFWRSPPPPPPQCSPTMSPGLVAPGDGRASGAHAGNPYQSVVMPTGAPTPWV